MALVLTTELLIEASDGSVPEAFRGVVKKVFPRDVRKGKGTDPDWTIQKIILRGTEKDVELLFKERDVVSRDWEGKAIHVQAARGPRGFKGLKRTDNNYNNKITPQVWVYTDAEVSVEDAGAHAGTDQAPPQDQSRTAPPVPSPAATAQQSRAPAANGNGHAPATNGSRTKEQIDAARVAEIKSFDKRIAKTSAALNRCYDAAVKLVASVNERHSNILGKPAPEFYKEVAMGMMTNACWTLKPAELADFPMQPFQNYDKPQSENTQAPAASNQRQPQQSFS